MFNHINLFKLILIISILITTTTANQQLDKIKLQLQWKHQFEFAGFYAAQEKGFYKDIGLDVEFVEYDNKMDITNEVLTNNAQYGVTYASIIAEYASGKPVVLLANFFKQSPLIIIAQENIKTPAQLKDKKIMGVSNSINNIILLTMLDKFDVSYDDIINIPASFNINDFVDKKVDAMSVFTTNEIFKLNKKGIKYNIFDPTVYGAKHYDINLFTTKKEAQSNPKRAKNFRDASIKGWEYALKHQNEIVDLIFKKYNTQKKGKEELRFEAKQIEQLMLPNLYKVGSIDKDRIKTISDIFIQSGFIKNIKNMDTDDFIFQDGSDLLMLTKIEKDFLKKHPTIVLGTGDSWSPYVTKNADGTITGYDNDILKRINKATGANFIQHTGDWTNIQKLAKENKIDGLSTLSITNERKEFLNFSNIYISLKKMVMVQQRNPLNITSTKDLEGKTIAIHKGNIADKKAAEQFKNSKIIYANTVKEMLEMVIYGKADVTFGNGATEYLLSKLGLPYLENAFALNKSLDLAFAVRKDWPEAISILNKGLLTIEKYERIQLKQKWFSSTVPKNNKLKLSIKEYQYLRDKKEITMCIDPDWMPFEKIDKGKHIGLSAEYISYFSKTIDIPIKLIHTKSWIESLNYAQDRKCDIFSLANTTKDRKKYMDFTTPYIDVPIGLVTKIGEPFINNLEYVKTKKLGIVKGYAINEILKEKYKDINIVEVDSLKDGLAKVKNGKLYGYLDNTLTMNYIIQQNYTNTLAISGQFLDKFRLGVATRNDEPLLHHIFEKAVQSLNDKTKDSLLQKWANISYSKSVDYTIVWQIIFISIILILGAIYWNRKLSSINKQLKIEKEKALESTKLKSKFLTNMSHEIRTPMNGIIGMNHLMLQTNIDSYQKKYLENINKSANILLDIINNILDASKIEAKKLTLEKNDFSMKEIVDYIKNSMEFKINEKQLEFSIINNTINDMYYGDSLRLSQIVINLVGNAVKFTHKGSIELTIKHKQNNRLEFHIKDTGLGLSEEQQDKIFQSFVQADETITKKYGGTGLGLAITKELIELMNGTIYVKSELNQGSEFIFEIELLASENNNSKVKDSITTINNCCLDDTIPNNCHILLVEDNVINQEIIINLLKDYNIKIDLASNGQDAIYKYKENKYHLILMDLQMPIMDGFTATKIIRETNNTIPIVALTANAMKNSIEKTKQVGMNDCITKPIDVKVFYEVLFKYISKVDVINEVKTDKSNHIQFDFKNIDTTIALENLGNNKEMFLKLLIDFYDEYKKYKELKLIDLNDDKLKQVTHTLKGLSGSIGAMSLHKVLVAYSQSTNKSLLPKIYNELHLVLDETKDLKIMKQTECLNLELTTTKRDELFSILKETIILKRPQKYKPILQELEQYKLSKEDKILFENVKTQLKAYQFKQALELL